MRRSRRGQLATEFALGFAALWAVLSGVVEFGYSMYLYNGLASAVANGALYASRATFEEPGTEFAEAVRNKVVYGSSEPTGSPLVAGLSTEAIGVETARDAAGIPRSVTVSVNRFRMNALFRTYTLEKRPSVTVRFGGIYRTHGS